MPVSKTPRTVTLYFRVTPAQGAAVQALAEATGQDVSSYLRSLVCTAHGYREEILRRVEAARAEAG